MGTNASGFAIGTTRCDSAFSAGDVSDRGDAGEVAVDHLVTLAEIADDSLRHGRSGNRQYGAHRTQDGSTGDCRAKGDRWVKVHRAGGDAGQQEVVLDLLVQ